MRHRVYGNKLGRTKNQRQALFRSLVGSLILHESIQTTEAKAKAVRGLVDKLITSVKKKSNGGNLQVQSFLVKPELIKRLQEDIVPRLSDRVSGYTQMVRLGARAGDGAILVRMSFIGMGQVDDKTIKPVTSEQDEDTDVEQEEVTPSEVKTKKTKPVKETKVKVASAKKAKK